MLRLGLSQLLRRRGRSVALGLAVLVAAVSVTLLAAAAGTSALRVRGTVKANFKPAYDVLVRPSDSFTEIERERGFVSANYLSGIFGGISFEQYERIKRIPGVEVAAPVANIGYLLVNAPYYLPVGAYVNDDPVQIYRVRATFPSHAGRSSYPSRDNYVYVTRRNPFCCNDFGYGREVVPGRAEARRVCGGVAWGGKGLGFYAEATGQTTPFWSRGPQNISCYSTLTPDVRARFLPGPGFWSFGDLWFPILLAAVDPAAEERLVRLSGTVTSGRGLRSDDGPAALDPTCIACGPVLPVIASSRTYLDTPLAFQIERLRVPVGVDVPAVLESVKSRRFVAKLQGDTVGTARVPAHEMYERALSLTAEYVDSGATPTIGTTTYWTVAPTRYGFRASTLEARLVKNPPSVWRSPDYGFSGGFYPAPPGSEDVQFRRLDVHASIPTATAQGGLVTSFRVVGRFDPEKLPGFSPLSRVPLESYYPPEVWPVDAASRRALKGGPLRPTMNLGDYVAQPPFLLTTLAAARAMVRRDLFKGANEAAPISAIRIRVAGATGPDELSQERIRLVAETIVKKTGLAVDVTAGSSPRQIAVKLPPGKYGRPALLVREGWVKKGVAVALVDALDRKSLGLLALVLAASGFFVANGALGAVRARRAEIGTLATFGWSRRSIFALILGELALIGLVAGLVGSVVAVGIVFAFGLELSLWLALLVPPVALALTVLAGLFPAARAAGMAPLAAIRPPVVASGRGRRVRRLAVLALVNLARVPGRSAVAVAGLVVGVAALTVLLAIQRAFEGSAVGTLLGNAVALQVRPADLVAAGLLIALAAAAVADVLYRSLRDRAAELATLRAFGWHPRQLATVVALEALLLGLAGSLTGAALATLAATTMLAVPAAPLALAAALATLGGTLASLLASTIPLTHLNRLTTPTVLAAE